VSYDIYKGKAAVNVKPVAPTFESRGNGSYTVQRNGGLMFEMAPAVSGTARAYDWSRKIMFSLSVNELGEILAMNPGVDLASAVEFVHDPSMGSPGAGQVMKNFRMTQMKDGTRPGAPVRACRANTLPAA
jgi:hypothetical protein